MMIKNLFYCLLLFIYKNTINMDSELKLHYAMLPIVVQDKKKKNIESDIFTALYNGMSYQINLTPQTGGQIIFKNKDFTSGFHLLITEKINLKYNKNGHIKGYAIPENDNSTSYKLYYIEINMFNDTNNTILYNWTITNIKLNSGQIIPEKTIIIYANPLETYLKNFPKYIKKRYPDMRKNNNDDSNQTDNQITTIVLPTIELCGNYQNSLMINHNGMICHQFGHNVVMQQAEYI